MFGNRTTADHVSMPRFGLWSWRSIGTNLVAQAVSFARFLVFGRAPDVVRDAGEKLARDARIDVVRGLALLVIFINHMPGNVVAGFMPHNFGFSDAADAFVLLAGISATLAYGSLIEAKGFAVGARRLFGRIRSIYLAHIAVFMIVCGVVAAAVTRTQNPLYIEAINIQPIFSDTLTAAFDALTLRYQPNYLDILPLYIVLLASFPVIYWAVRLSPLATLAASVALWQGAVAAGINLTNTGASGWFFNPFAWQLLFTIGVVIGRCAQRGIGAPRLHLLDFAAAAFLLFSVIVKTSSGNPFGIGALNDWIDTVQMGTDKTNLAFVRVAHIVALAWLIIRFVPAGVALLALPGGRLLAGVGRHSLEVFCTGVVLSIIGQIVLAETSFALGPQLLVCLTGVIMLVGLGIFLSWYQSVTLARAKRPSPLASQVSSPHS